MFVSQRQEREAEVEGLTWLQRQLAWERVLDRLRQGAGVAPAAAGAAREERPAA